jgi:uncharacterized membrane protein
MRTRRFFKEQAMPRSIHPAALRRWLSPLTAALFVLVSLSGILMHGPGMHALHEGSAYLFLGACLVHLGLNWKVFREHLRHRAAWVALGLCILLAGAFLGSGLGAGTGARPGPAPAVSGRN